MTKSNKTNKTNTVEHKKSENSQKLREVNSQCGPRFEIPYKKLLSLTRRASDHSDGFSSVFKSTVNE